MMRALAYYRRTGRQEAAGRLIDRLLPRATTPTALAALWTERGSLLASTDDPKAMEAFDMALSYDPTCRAAVDGLAELLERRGEWQQLIDLLEARIDAGSAGERAMCLRRLARIARQNQRDDASAEIYLRRAAALQPTAEDFEQLLDIVGDGEDRRVDRETLLAERLALAGPFVPTLTQAGIRLTAEDQRRWAWCVLSPLMMTIVQDSALKSLVLDLRKEFEKADTLPLLSPELHRRLLPAGIAPPLYDVLAELDALLPLGPTSIEAIASGRGTRVDAKTGLGKTFAAIAERLGLPDAVLSRVEDLSVPCRVLDEERPHVVARADLFTALAPGEVHAILALMLEQARPGARMLASLPNAEARRVLTALFAAIGREVGEGAEIAALEERITAAAGRERLDCWAAQLSAVDNLTDCVPEALAEAARRVGLVAAGEVRSAAKLVTRLEEAAPKIPEHRHRRGPRGVLCQRRRGTAPVGVRHLAGLRRAPDRLTLGKKEDIKAKLRKLRDRLAFATPRARTRGNTPPALLERLEAAAEVLNAVCRFGGGAEAMRSDTLDELYEDAIVEGHLALHEWERWRDDESQQKHKVRAAAPLGQRRQHERHETSVLVSLARHGVHGGGAVSTDAVQLAARNVSLGGILVMAGKGDLATAGVGSVVRVAQPVERAPLAHAGHRHPARRRRHRAALARRDGGRAQRRRVDPRRDATGEVENPKRLFQPRDRFTGRSRASCAPFRSA